MFNSIILKINILSFMTGFLEEILSVHPQSPAVTAPSGHAAPLRYAGTSTASVPLQETSLTLRCGPEGPSHLNPQSLRDSPLLKGATLFLPPRRGTCRRPRACSLIGNSM